MKHAKSLEVLRLALLAVGLVLIGVPFLWIILTAFKRPVDAAAVPPKFISPVTLANFTTLQGNGFFQSLINSTIITVATLAVTVGIPTAATAQSA